MDDLRAGIGMIDQEIVAVLDQAALDQLVAERVEQFVNFFLAREVGDEEAGGLGGGDDLVFVGGGGLAEQGRLHVLDDLLARYRQRTVGRPLCPPLTRSPAAETPVSSRPLVLVITGPPASGKSVSA